MFEIKLNHLIRLTDDTGLIQHANWHCPNYHEGYTTDDNARALAFCIMYANHEKNTATESLIIRYLSFLDYAFNPKERKFRNFLSFERRWLEQIGSEDSQARALWALCITAVEANDQRIRELAECLLEKSLSKALDFTYPRPWAYTLVGCKIYLRQHNNKLMQLISKSLAERLLHFFDSNREEEWDWFEPQLTYCNAILPHGLLAAGELLGSENMTLSGIKSLNWLARIQHGLNGDFSPIGSEGFYYKGKKKAQFIQQPVEAYTSIDAYLEAYHTTKDRKWLNFAFIAADWFVGSNDLNIPLYDCETGGCQDGLRESGINPNQGAESTLAYLFTALKINFIMRN